jgi:hypothetical protein
MATLCFDKNFTKLVNRFCEEDSATGVKIFNYMYDFMIFAAMVGRHEYNSCKDVALSRGQKEIKDSTFTGQNLQGYAYMLALESEKSGNIFRAGNENELWKNLESYAYLGCTVIERWVIDNPLKALHEIVLEKIKEIAIPLAEVERVHKKIDLFGS